MSKRFGRNQKRAFRAELAETNATNQHLINELGRERNLNQDCKEILVMQGEAIRMTREVLGRYFPTLPVIETYTGYAPDLPITVAQEPHVSYHASAYAPRAEVNDLIFRTEQLYALKGSVVLSELQRCMTVYSGYINEGVSYRISEQALRHMPQGVLEGLLIRDFIPHLVQQLKGKYHV